MIQASITVTIRILQAQIALATKALNNPAFIATLRTALDALEVASDEVVGAIDPVATSILSRYLLLLREQLAYIWHYWNINSFWYASHALSRNSSCDVVFF